MPYMEWVWLAAMVVFLIMEASSILLVSVWFVIGSLVALIATLLGAPLWLQCVLFLTVSVGLLLSLRPLLRKYYTPKKIQTNAPSNIGKLAVVTERIDNLHAQGAVKLSGLVWTARSVADAPVAVGSVVRVARIEGVKLIVELADE